MENFWETISNIKTPLAALCFIAGIIYLVIKVVVSSNNKRKEKSLTVQDPQAQRIAAENILKDYPDVKVDTISDDAGKVEIAKLIIRSRSTLSQRAFYAFIILAIIFAAAYLVPNIISGVNNDDAKKTEQEFLKHNSWALLKAIKAKYPYGMLSVIQHIKFRDILVGNERKRLAEFRNTYTISAARDINASENVFSEEFSTGSAILKPWPGSEIQNIVGGDDRKFWVNFDLAKYQTKTIITGLNYVYSFPITGGGENSCFGNICGPTEWMTCYPNEFDYIDKMTIIVEGDGVDIHLPPNAMYRKSATGSIKNEDGHCRQYSSNKNCTLVAQWDTLTASECVAFKIAW